MVWLLDGTLKATLLLLFAALIAWRIRPAAGRHLVWALAMTLALLMPLFSWGVPDLMAPFVRAEPSAVTAPTLPAQSVPATDRVDVAAISAAPSPRQAEAFAHEPQSGPLPSVALERGGDVALPPAVAAGEPGEPATRWRGWPTAWPAWVAAPWLVPVWFGGMLFSVLPLVLGWASLLRLQRQAMRMGGVWPELLAELQADLGLQRRVVLLQSRERSMPMTWGAVPGLPAYILLPKDCCEWSHDRRRAVLLHELAHIQRWDCLTQTLAQLTCALYWFHPLVWYGAHRMLIERERACDDRVLMQDMRASDYAEHLLSIARSRQGLRLAGFAGIAMARQGRRWWGREGAPQERLRGGLSERVMAILDAHRQRAAFGRLKVALLIAVMGAITLPVAMLQALPIAERVIPSVSFDPKLPWRSSHWAGENNARRVHLDRLGEHARFLVFDAGRRHVWTRYWTAMPIDARAQYPILVMQYRAEGTHPTSGGYVLWLDDGTGPNHGGLRPIRSSDLVADGQVHEIRRDMRVVDGGKMAGDLIGMALGVHCGEGGAPASFELIRLAFEADPEAKRHEVAEPIFAAPIDVRVVDPQGQSVAGAQVQVDGDRLDRVQMAATDAQGRATVVPRLSEGGEHRVRVTAAGHVAVERSAIAPGQSLEVTLDRDQTFSGVAVDEAGEPVAGAVVSFWITRDQHAPDDGLITPDAVLTDAQGRWQQSGFPANHPQIRPLVQHPDFIVERYPNEIAPPPSLEAMRRGEARSVLRRGALFAGTVLDHQGQPVRNALVGLGRERVASNAPPSTRTDAEGRFRFENLPFTEQIVTVSAGGHGPAQVHVSQSALTEPLQITLTEPNAIHFRVVDPEGEPIVNATVASDTWRETRALLWRGRTNEEGRVVWKEAPADGMAYEVMARDRMSARRRVMLPQAEEHVITLHPPLTIRGQVTDARTGEPIENFQVMAGIGWENRPADQIHWQPSRLTHGQEGRYEVRQTYPYPQHYLRFQAEGYRPVTSAAFTSEQGAQTLDIQLEPGSGLAGIVLTPEGTPAAGASIYLLEPGQQMFIHDGGVQQSSGLGSVIRTDSDGRFVSSAVESERIVAWCVLHDRGYSQWRKGEEGDWARIQLQPWAGLRGRAMTGTQPHTGIHVTVDQGDFPDGSQPSSRAYILWKSRLAVDDQGHFVSDRLPAGEVTVAKLLPTGSRSSRYDRTTLATLVSGQVLEDFQLGGGGRSVVGQVVYPEGFGSRTWSWVNGSLESPPDPTLGERLREKSQALAPEGFSSWPQEQQVAWRQSDAGRAAMRELQRYQSHLSPPNYAVVVDDIGHFHAEDVPAGDYRLVIRFHEMEGGTSSGRTREAGRVQTQIEIPEFTTEQMDQPLEIGEVPFIPATTAP